MKKHSLRTELVLWSVLTLLFFMASQMFVTSFFAHYFATADKRAEIDKLMLELTEHYSDSPIDIYEIVEYAQVINNLRIMVFSDEQVIYHSASLGKSPDRSTWILEKENIPLDMDPLDMDLPDFLNIPTSSVPEMAQTLLQELELDVVGTEHTFQYEGENRTIVIWCSNLAIADTVQLFTSVNLRVSILVIALSILGVLFFSRRLISPIVKMEAVARNVAELDFSMEVGGNVRTRELNSLALSINQMSKNLEKMINQLNRDNRSLSDKVENQEKLNQMRRQFVANISHEMKTPLSMLMMYSENLKLDLPDIDKTFYYDTIIEEAAGLNAMVEQLLDTSAVENGLSQVDLQEMDFSLFVSEQVVKTLPLLDSYVFTQEIQPHILVKGDRKYLEQSVRNYLTNAISHTLKGGEITLRVYETDQVYFEIYNEGKPVPEEDLPYLWDSFYRGDKSRTQVGEKRVGLGLYIVKTCISSHFGQVSVENYPNGVTFSFQLPKIKEA